MAYNAPAIGALSAHEYNKVRQSFDKYQQTQKGKARPGLGRGDYRDMTAANAARSERSSFKRGSYGIEDEYRYMVSKGFQPQAAAAAARTPAPQAAAPAQSAPPAYQAAPAYNPPPVDTSMQDMFAAQVQQMQQAYQQSMMQQQQQFQQMQAQQEERMAALQQQMNQASAAAQLAERQQVMGVQAAQSSVGTPMQIARRGASGAFGRRGLRIKSLNV